MAVIQGFDFSDPQPPPALEISVEGLTSSGKSYIGLSAPGPVAVIDVDLGTRGVIEQFKAERPPGSYGIYVCRYIVPGRPKALRLSTAENDQKYRDMVCEAMLPVWEELRDRILAARDMALNKKVRSIVLDGALEAYQLLNLARLGRMEAVWPVTLYGPVKLEFASILKALRYTGANLIVTSKLGDEWMNTKNAAGKEVGTKTGRKVRKGYDDLISHFEVAIRITPPVRSGNGTVMQERRIEFIKCRYANSNYLEGMSLDGDKDFKTLAALIRPEVDPAVWE